MTKKKRPLLVRLAFWALVAFLVGLPIGLAFLEYTTRPQFCSSCHIMEPYVKSWEDSAHGRAGVGCVECHYEPGIVETAEGKFKAINQVVKYVTGTEGTKPWAEVSDNSCMRSGCHSARLLTGKVEFELGRTSIAFDHAPHLLEMRRSKKLRCTSCHSQIVQGEHLTVTTSTCLLCHFKGAEEDPKLSECTTCHRPPAEPIDVGGFQFEHAEYLQRGVGCEQCHADVTQGTGEVPVRRCGSCHAVQEHIERRGETEFMHRTHVTEHKVDCLECHTEMTHRLREKKETAKGECATCHRLGHGPAEAFYRGEGGRGVVATPNPMYLTRVGCASCHDHFGPGEGGEPLGQAVRGKEVACVACHGTKVDGLMRRWQEVLGPAAEQVAAEVAAARKALDGSPAATAALRASLDDAAHDARLVVADGTKGVHNPWFARKLLATSFERAQAAFAAVDPQHARRPSPVEPPFATKLDCAQVCHMGVEKQDVRVAGTRFVHAQHLGKAGNDCDACHSATEHGTVLPAARDCTSCHHGEKAAPERTCASCHAEQDRFLRGVGDDGEEGAQMMAKVACAECHGAAPKAGVRARDVVQPQCDRCHDGKYATSVADWTAEADQWLADADARLAKLRAAGRSGAKLAAAEAIVARVRTGRAAHNVLLFEELKEAFEDAAK